MITLRPNHLLLTWFLLALTLGFPGCRNVQPASTASHLGDIEVQVSGNEAAQAAVQRGMLLLHNFEYEDARTAFREAQTQDPYCAMAYWGEAMTHHYPIWDRQDLEAGQTALLKWEELRPESPHELSRLEGALIQAAQVLFGPGSKDERCAAYAQVMAELQERYPQNHEVAAHYALSLLGSVPDGRDYDRYAQAARIAEGILAENRNHPGALHYLIHAYDDPNHASLALDAAHRYAKVAPDAAHALHMPSHIFVAQGMWREVVASNVASYDASVDRMYAKQLDHDARSYHALAWLHYGLLQQGRTDPARQILEDMIRYTDSLPSRQARGYLIDMLGSYLVATDGWASDYESVTVEDRDLNVSTQAAQHFIRGMRGYVKGDQAAVAAAYQALQADLIRARNLQSTDTGAGCGIPTGVGPRETDLNRATIRGYQLQALQAALAQDPPAVGAALAKAVALADATDFAYGPPEVVLPAHEHYADWLLQQGRAEEASRMYLRAESRTPRRRRVLDGLAAALAASGQESRADSVQAVLSDIDAGIAPDVAYSGR